MSRPPELAGWKHRIGLYGDFWTEFLLVLLRILPVWVCLRLTGPIALVFYALATSQRRAIITNLSALRPDQNTSALWWAGSRVFTQFALTYMDRLWSLHLGKRVTWRVENVKPLEGEIASINGILLFTTHSGNYDMGAAFFAETFKRPMHIVRVPEGNKALQKLRASEFTRMQSDIAPVQVCYAGSDWMLGLELFQIVSEGGVVAIQADRPINGNDLRADFDQINFRLPRGPFILARIAKTPCYPIFVHRSGWCEYTLTSGPPVYDGKTRKMEEEIARDWLAWMTPILKRHWNQWFVFEPVLERRTQKQSVSGQV